MRGWAWWSCFAAVLSATSCFRGDFLDNTCEQLPAGCGATTTTATTTAPDPTTTAPTTTDDTTTAAATCVPTMLPAAVTPPSANQILEPAFRIREVALADPHLFASALACNDVQAVAMAALNDSFKMFETNLVFLASGYDGDAANQSFAFFRQTTCDKDGNYCLREPANPGYLFTVDNRDEDDCAVEVVPNSADPNDIKVFNRPIAPCFTSQTLSFQLDISPGVPPLALYLGHLAATYAEDECDPTGLTRGVITGFVRREDAMKTTFHYGNSDISMWSLIRGSDGSDCPVPPGDVPSVDMVDLPGEGPVVGVWLYLNFEADRIPMYDP